MPGPCRCGSPRDARGLCTHCDYRADCTVGCVACRTRDSHCVICGARCGTPVGASYHERNCRAAEARHAA